MKNLKKLIAGMMLFLTTAMYGQIWNIGYPNAEDVTATFNNGVLTISGTGEMMLNSPPWCEYSSLITQVIIQDGVTNVFYLFPIYASCDFSNLVSIEIPESIIEIGPGAFDGTLWYNSQPDGLVYIDKWLYKYKGTMPNETAINIFEETLGIASRAFFNKTDLTSVIIPESVINIGYGAFENCNSLTAIISLRVVPISIYLNCFYGVNKDICRLYVPAGSKEAYQNPVYGWQDFNIIELPEISGDDIDFTPTTDGATIEWQAVESAEGYRIIIYSDEAHTDIVCTLEFNAAGELVTILKGARSIMRTASTTNFSYTVENLQSGKDYYYTLEILGVSDVVLANLSGEFTTSETTGIDVPLTEPAERVVVGYYNALGSKLATESEKGFYIIKLNNGKTEKILK